jgi:hypothetical protein
MSVTHQYELFSENTRVGCGNINSISGLTITATGHVKFGASTVTTVKLYYVGEADSPAEFHVPITGTAADPPTVDSVRLDATTGASGFSARWSVTDGVLNMYFGVPATADAEGNWSFWPSTPTLNLKVKVKRQTTAITCP